jgi:AcrR family transcriptional regulator
MAGAARGKGEREPLSRERIEVTALEVIEAESLDGFSIRKLAGALSCEAMSIYYYFPSKGHLMDALVDRIVAAELTVLDPAKGQWREQLAMSAWEWRAMALRHPSLFMFLSLHRFNTPTALRWLNGVIGLLMTVGIGEEMATRLFRVVGYYLNGAMMDETAGYTRGPSTVEPVPEEVMVRDYPAVVRAGRWFAPAEREQTFRVGLELVLDRIAAEIEWARE